MTNEPENVNNTNAGAEEAQAKPKKKKPIMIFRPQNSRTGAVKAGVRPGTASKPGMRKDGARPEGARVRKPADASAAAGSGARTRRPAAGAAGPAKTPTPADAAKIISAAAAAAEEKIASQAAAAAALQAEKEKAAESAPAVEKKPEAVSAAPVKDAAAAPAQTETAKTADQPDPAVAESGPAPQETGKKPAAETAEPALQQENKPADLKAEGAQPARAASTEEQPAKASDAAARETKDTSASREGARSSAAGNSSQRFQSQGRTARNTGSQERGERTGGSSDRARTGQGSSAGRSGSGYGSRSTDRQDRQDRSDRGGRGAAGGFQNRGGARDGARDGQRKPAFGSGDNRSGQGAGRGSFAGSGSRRPSGNGRGPAMDSKPFEKDSRRNDRGSRNDRRNDRNDRQDKFDRMENRSQGGKNGSRSKQAGKFIKPVKPVVEEEKIKSITVPETLTIKDLADLLKIQPAAIVKKLFLQGRMVTVNEEIDFDTAEEIAIDYDVICEKEVKVDVIEELLKEDEDPEDSLQPRPPVVCVMGHVDHGKTSLLDAIRNTHVIDREAGGITQHIGASVVTCNGQKITFLDTPGHEAFTAMRMRGANSTDIAILVVAADDGVMPQTVEAINHAKAAGIEIIVAINKIDKPGANIEKVKQELTEYELIPEDWGGSTVFVPVSAKTREGIDTLLEMILLTSEVLELKANPDRRARGLVIEAQLDKGRGPVATVLVQKGKLHVGDPIAAGSCYGKVRAMIDDKGRSVKEAGPSTPVEVLGLSDVPGAGEIFVSPETEKEARSFAETFISEEKERLIDETRQKMSLDDLFSQIQAGNLKELDLIVKADVQGSVEAVKQSLLKLSNEEVVVKVIHSGAGAINESDVVLAAASNAIIIGFNVRIDPSAKSTAEQEGVDIRMYRVIYDAIADVEAAMKGMLDPVFEEKVIGHAEIRQIFRASGVGNIAGSYVLDGVFQRGCNARITREGKQIFDGPVASLKRFKDDVKEVRAGYECGLVFEKFNDIAELDQVEAYMMVEVPR